MKALSYIIVAALLFISCGENAEKETFYIPQNYTGPIAIVFDQKNGVEKEYKDGRRIYRIPKSGVLYTQLSRVKGILNEKFYYVNSSGEITEELSSLTLPILEITKYDSSRIYALEGFDGGFSKTEGNIVNVKYIAFCVGKATKSDSLVKATHKLIDRFQEVYPEQVK